MIDFRLGEGIELMRTLEDSSIDMILTDPPYPKKYQHLYGEMAKEASRILKVGGHLVTLCGHYQVPDITADMGKYLRYWWIGGMMHDTLCRMPGKWVCIRWKPCLWYVKERRNLKDYECPMDMFKGVKDKKHHIWGQGLPWFEHWIRLCPEGGVVLDPFVGGGTTAIACINTHRNFIGCEINENTFEDAKNRIDNYLAGEVINGY